MMSKQQRLYYEYTNKERLIREIAEYYRQLQELEKQRQHRFENYY